MKKLFSLYFISALFILNINYAYAQISQGGNPLSIDQKNLKSNIPIFNVNKPDMEKILMEDLENMRKGRAHRTGILVETNINPKSHGLWETLPNGDLLWRIKINSSEALGTALYFDDFYLPAGAKLFVYTPKYAEIIGAFTDFNNHESRLMATQSLRGEEFIIELFLPKSKTLDYSLNISEVAHIYRGSDLISDKGADYCLVNINCPEGTNWQTHKRSVARVNIRIGSGYFLCTGSLMNNTHSNCIPYFLLADHCAYYNSYATAANLNQWVFNFNYEASQCGGTSGSTNQSVTGCSLISHDTYGMNSQGSDFYLVRFNNNVPNTYQPYFNGWNRANTGATSGVSIHHPDGDIKKISTFTQAATNYFTNHWLIRWAQTVTNHSVTEGGSSGSPLYNQSGLVVGTLTGGGSFCATPNEPDIYGKFSRHWDAQGTTADKQLRPWLDPVGSNPISLQGVNFNNCTSISVEDIKTVNTNITVFPNPANDFVNLKFENYYFNAGTVRIFDVMGKLVSSFEISKYENEFVFSVTHLENGIYFINAQNENNNFSKSFIISR